MTEPAARVALLSLDAVGHPIISPTVTPHLWALREAGGWAPNGGPCDVPAVTYVSHATLATGTSPATHGITSNRAASPIPGTVPGWTGYAQVQTPTLFRSRARRWIALGGYLRQPESRAVARIASAIGAQPPHLADWAPTIAALLGVPLPTAEGRNLLA